ncbi:MAG TPA: MFS transporter [Streptosporangiaceae bacterium]
MAFAGSGFAFASWASRIPQVRERLHLHPSALGLLLLSIALGSLVSLPMSGPLVGRLGSRRTVSAMAILMAVALFTVSFGYLAGLLPVVAGLFLLGFANGAWDVAMNVQGAIVEQLAGRSIMSRFHAGWSLGTVAGALAGAVMVALGVPVTAHLTATALIVGVSVPAASRAFVPDRADGDATAGRAVARISALAAWREPRTLMIGVFVLAFAFAEGTGNDWISVAVIDDYHAPPAVGTLVFAAFLIAMTTGRWCGPPLLDRYGRVRVVRSLAVVAVAGLMLFVFGPSILAAFAGVLLWGAGTALGFPVGMSAGADDPGRAASRVSVIASVGYCAFLGGPPLIGFLADHNTVRTALIAVAVLLALATVTASAIRRPAGLPDSG